MRLMKLQVLTPEKVFFEGEVASVTARGWEGYLGIYHDHTPLVTPLAPGVLTIRTGDGEIRVASAAQGLMEVKPDSVTILVDAAEWPEEIDVERAKKAKERAERRLEEVEERRESTDILWARIALQRALTRIKVAERRRKRHR